MTWKRCKIRGKLVLITYWKSQMGFRMVPKSVTLNDLDRRNGRVRTLRYFAELGSFGALLRTPIHTASEM